VTSKTYQKNYQASMALLNNILLRDDKRIVKSFHTEIVKYSASCVQALFGE